jgi:hypothetical protein
MVTETLRNAVRTLRSLPVEWSMSVEVLRRLLQTLLAVLVKVVVVVIVAGWFVLINLL